MDLRDASLLIDHVCDASRILIFRAVGRAVRQSDLVIGIAQQRKIELLLVGEFLIRFDAVEAGAEDLRVFGGVFSGEVPEPETFGRSARCVGLWKEPEDDFLSAKVAELDAAAGVIARLELGSSVADFQHRGASSNAFQHVTHDSSE